MSHFRAQPILDATSLEVVALEVLAADADTLPFGDATAMAAHDLAALEYAGILCARTGLRAHCNVEWTTLMLAAGHVTVRVRPGIVIELVERFEALERAGAAAADAVLDLILEVRRRGGAVAMDDVTSTGPARDLIRSLRPEIVKVENRNTLADVRRFCGATIIAERIETARHAELARKLGAGEIQGFWCDRQAAGNAGHQMAENPIPTGSAAGRA
ncbi:EAL domain-containing protein [Pelomicrobium methylotrophicum]|nr:EAL domain-containing protein [Pelomicrobium methylotrophicum]